MRLHIGYETAGSHEVPSSIFASAVHSLGDFTQAAFFLSCVPPPERNMGRRVVLEASTLVSTQEAAWHNGQRIRLSAGNIVKATDKDVFKKGLDGLNPGQILTITIESPRQDEETS